MSNYRDEGSQEFFSQCRPLGQRLGSDQAIILIFNQYRPNNRCFETLKGHFWR